MSRSIQRSKCHSSCVMCKPHKVTGERPIGERRTLGVGEDLAAIDHLHWTDMRDFSGAYDWIPDDYHLFDGDPYSGHTGCDLCWSCIECGDCECPVAAIARMPIAPLRVPLADLARCA